MIREEYREEYGYTSYTESLPTEREMDALMYASQDRAKAAYSRNLYNKMANIDICGTESLDSLTEMGLVDSFSMNELHW